MKINITTPGYKTCIRKDYGQDHGHFSPHKKVHIEPNTGRNLGDFGYFSKFILGKSVYRPDLKKQCIYRAFRENLVKNCEKRP